MSDLQHFASRSYADCFGRVFSALVIAACSLETPGVEISLLFRKVRDDVLAATGRKQEPFTYGSLPSEELFFRQPKP